MSPCWHGTYDPHTDRRYKGESSVSHIHPPPPHPFPPVILQMVHTASHRQVLGNKYSQITATAVTAMCRYWGRGVGFSGVRIVQTISKLRFSSVTRVNTYPGRRTGSPDCSECERSFISPETDTRFTCIWNTPTNSVLRRAGRANCCGVTFQPTAVLHTHPTSRPNGWPKSRP